MRRAGLLCLALLLVSLSAGARDAGREEVERAFTRFITAFNNLDWETFRQAFADDASVFNPDIPEAPTVHRLDGRAEVEEGFRSVFEATRKRASGPPYLHIVPRAVRIQMLGSAAVVSFEFDRDGGSVGRRTIVFGHQAGGWKIEHIHASNVPPRQAPAAPLQR